MTIALKKKSFTLPSPISTSGLQDDQSTQELRFVKPTVEANLKLARSSALTFLKSNEDVENSEEYSDALMGLWRAVESWTPDLAQQHECTWSSYAIRCMRNAILDGYKQRKIKYHEELVDFTEMQIVDPRSSNADLVDELFTMHSGDTFFTTRAKQILHEHYIERKTLKEIAKQLGVSSPYIHQLLQKAKLLMREKFGIALQG
ncbi:MAG: sigma-70 family RNA polymerase sigma factor [Proteobacteria bacterium]|jgi:RNA polymerase sigma factor (sigma-70 family)|nr:sigma-70 family RNA polymerase sigma factor [Pseudomonadota bacterium]